MRERILEELILLRQRYPDAEYHEQGGWIRIPAYPLPEGWNRTATDVAFQVQNGYPATAPYGIYVPAGIRFQGATPTKYREPAKNQPPFDGTWGVFSWSADRSQWTPTADVRKGSNLLNWVIGVAERFRDGR